MFKEYLHVEKFGNTAVEGIELGNVYVFPKIDGTNASMWAVPAKSHNEGQWGHFRLALPESPVMSIRAGSRTRELDLEKDNAGFCAYAQSNDAWKEQSLLLGYPHLRLYGEWLVPHTFKGYQENAWRRFYVFDVFNDETGLYLSYDAYKPLLDNYGIEYVPPLAIIKNGEYTRFVEFLAKNFFLIPDGNDPGEGVVLKNYDFQNKFGQQAYAKIIRNEFKAAHHKAMGPPQINEKMMNEERLVTRFVTGHEVDKTIAKIKTEKGEWSSKNIPELFGRMFYDLVKESLWDGLQEINYGTVNFKTLKALMIAQVKSLKPEIFR